MAVPRKGLVHLYVSISSFFELPALSCPIFPLLSWVSAFDRTQLSSLNRKLLANQSQEKQRLGPPHGF